MKIIAFVLVDMMLFPSTTATTLIQDKDKYLSNVKDVKT
jgi:hypothetical protein